MEETLDNELKEELVFVKREYRKCSSPVPAISLPMKIQGNPAKEHKRTVLTEVCLPENVADSSVLKQHNRLGNHSLSCQYKKMPEEYLAHFTLFVQTLSLLYS